MQMVEMLNNLLLSPFHGLRCRPLEGRCLSGGTSNLGITPSWNDSPVILPFHCHGVRLISRACKAKRLNRLMYCSKVVGFPRFRLRG